MKKHKVIAMLSGGLDSTLAAKMMIDQGIEVIGFNMVNIFSTDTRKAVETAELLGIKIISKPHREDFIDVVRNPKHGYGKGINPCIDCRIYVLKIANEIMIESNAAAIVTGEVLEQRPMSQKRHMMRIIDKESGLEGKILRPLSALLLEETEIEKKGIVDRSRLLDISGRQRKIQLQMAKDMGLSGFSCGTGGCLLTDKNMKTKLLDLFSHKKEVSLEDIPRLKIGRHFRFEEDVKFVLGRNMHENSQLEKQRKTKETLIIPKSFSGPTALIEKTQAKIPINSICNVIHNFSKQKDDNIVVDIIDDNGAREETVEKQEVEFDKYWISKG